jgi:hypothetical protein
MKFLRIGFALLLCSSLPAQSAHSGLRHLKNILQQQGFTGALQGKIHFTRIGRLQCNAETYDVIYHEWEQSHPAGARHAAYRVLFIDKQDRYIGSYRVPERPISVTPQRILFNLPEKQGNTLRCDRDGLPAEVILGDETSPLFK